MRSIFILGSGGFAKEVYCLLVDIGNYNIGGFIDKDEKPDLIIGSKRFRVFDEAHLNSLIGKDVCLAIGVGDPDLIKNICSKFKDKFEFPNLIHPTFVGNLDDIILGRGNIITANCIFTTSIHIGSFNIFNLACTVGHDVKIEDYNIFNPVVNISGGVCIGSCNMIGVNATILQYKTIGNNNVVGASSLVTKNVSDNYTVIGVPAVRIK